MKILDCSLTYGASINGTPPHGCDTFTALTAELDRAGISGGLVRCRYSDTAGVNYGNNMLARDLKKGREAGYDLYGVWAALPPFTGETPAPEALPAAMRQNGIAAVYLAPAVHRYEPTRLTLGPLMEVLQARRIPVILNTALGVSMPQIYALLEAFPRHTALVGDADCWPNARRLYPLAASYPNVRLDLSYVMDAGGVEDPVSRFGARKLLFGTAFPDRYTGSMLAVVRAARIGEEDRALIFGGNLERLIKEADFS